jgi:hypothetical protein
MTNLCKTCGETDISKFYKQKWICKGCWNRMTYDRSRAKLDQLIAERGGCCERCGYNKSNNALQWHHRDPEAKEFSISQHRGSNIEKLREETAKCDLLCANCHAEVHEQLPPNPTARARKMVGPVGIEPTLNGL